MLILMRWCKGLGETCNTMTDLVRHLRLVPKCFDKDGEDDTNGLLVGDHIRVVLADSRHYPSNGFPYFGIRIIEHCDQIGQPWHNHIHELDLIRSLCNGTK
jgi:hypothetical protein